ncbi:DUF6266 family protein [Desertivirga xinjiangensis]|uniref:DUF6266 family protein n=1 Tax=Desertivirga xinjiangensis TaxID=539206 RepID=UPI00210A3C6D|nr:DUF6266 family protein [Pedobacter xinjiangensis]
MARYKNGINGPFRGKAGSVVGCKWKEIDYIRGLPKRSSKPPTKKKATAQQVFAFVQKWLKPINGLVNVGFADVHPNRTGLMSAHSYNQLNALAGGYPNMEIDYSKARFSMGSLRPASSASMQLINDHTLLIEWDTSWDSTCSYDDSLMYFIYFPDLGQVMLPGESRSAQRKDGRLIVNLEKEFINSRLEVQIAFKSVLTSAVSTSQYLGGIRFDAEVPEIPTVKEPREFCATVSLTGILRVK